MKQLLPFLFLFFSYQALACPMCNIHNYLYSSLSSSTHIYRGKVIQSEKDDKAVVEILEILKNDKNELPKVGEVTTEHLYRSEEYLGQEFIFSNPFGRGPTFALLETDLKWEINYLIDSTRTVSSVDEAIRLVEGISRKSNKDGINYIKDHFNEAFESLASRMGEFRRECQLDTDVYFGSYRLPNLVRALTAVSNEQTKQVLWQEIDSIQFFDPGLIHVDDLKFNGTSPIGEYLRQIVSSTKEESYHEELIEKYVNALKDNQTSSDSYFAYALAFDHLEVIDELEITENNRKAVVLGLLCTALNHRYYRQHKKLEPILTKIEALNQDSEITAYINKRFMK